MQLHSLFLRSEMIFWRFGSEVTDQGDHIVIRTSANPTWRWGNLLLFPAPPKASDITRWTELNIHTFGAEAPLLFVWDTPTGQPGDAKAFVEQGFEFTRQPLLIARSLALPSRHSNITDTRVITKPEDWEQVVAMNVEAFAKGSPSYQDYIERKFFLFRNMARAGLGFWMGAYEGGELVGSCGIFNDGSISRYQEVVTAEAHRNKGVCSKLIVDAFDHARGLDYPKQTLIAVDSDSQAERIYRRAGFRDCEMTCALRFPERSTG